MPVLFLGALFGLIGSIFVNVGSAIIKVVRAVMPIVSRVFDALKFVVSRIGQNAGRFFRFIAGAARAVYDNVLVPIGRSLVRWYKRFTDFLRRVFGPIIEIFDRIRSILNEIWVNIIAPILEVIEKVRAVFRILAQLGVPFAKEIERILQQIQREIFNRFRQVQSWVNTATFWLDLLLDPRGWIRATPFLYTIYRWSGNVLNIITKLADGDGFNRARFDERRVESAPRPIDTTLERFRNGDFGKERAVQSAAARFRSGHSGRFT